MGLEVKPPDVNCSRGGFTVLDDRTVLYSLGAVRTVGMGAVQFILDEREKNGPYQSLMDFCLRIARFKTKKSVIRSLLQAGVLDSLGSRSAMLQGLDATYSRAEARAQDRLAGQDSLFGGESNDDTEEVDKAPPSKYRELSHERLLQLEKAVLGFYLSEHPVTHLAGELRRMTGHSLGDESGIPGFKGRRDDAPMHRFAGVVAGVKRRGQRGHGALFALDDGTHRAMFSMYDEDYRTYGDLLSHEGVVVVEGRKVLDPVRETARWYAKRVLTIDQARALFAKSLLIEINSDAPSERLPGQLKKLLEPFVGDGRCPVQMRLKIGNVSTVLSLSGDWRIKPCEELFRRVEALDGFRRAALTY